MLAVRECSAAVVAVVVEAQLVSEVVDVPMAVAVVGGTVLRLSSVVVVQGTRVTDADAVEMFVCCYCCSYSCCTFL